MTAPDRATLGERAARALQSALGEPLAKVLERVTALLVAVQEEEREACAKLADDEKVYSGQKADEGRDVVPWVARRSCAREIAIDIRARGNESKTGGR